VLDLVLVRDRPPVLSRLFTVQADRTRERITILGVVRHLIDTLREPLLLRRNFRCGAGI
jgi:hypothetical protein